MVRQHPAALLSPAARPVPRAAASGSGSSTRPSRRRSPVLIAACFLRFGLTLTALVESIFCATLVTVTVTDLQRRVIPNRIVLPAAAVVLVGMTVAHPSPQWAIAALGASAFLLVFALAVPGGMGMGDVKLAFLIGAGLGRVTPVAMMVGLLAALVPSLFLLARHGRRARKMKIPFGPGARVRGGRGAICRTVPARAGTGRSGADLAGSRFPGSRPMRTTRCR